jgi:sugar/nucleoside kinase (ribokinase family)
LETLFLQLPRPKTGSAAPVAHRHPTPHAALLAALGEADPADRLVVLGSFYTVGAVLVEGVLTHGLEGLCTERLESVLERAARAAAITCSRPGADPPWADELERVQSHRPLS